MMNKEHTDQEFFETVRDHALHLDLGDHFGDSEKNTDQRVLQLMNTYRDQKQDFRNHADPEISGEWSVALRKQEETYRYWLDGNPEKTKESLENFWRNELGVIVKQYATYNTLKASSEKSGVFFQHMVHDFIVWKHLFEVSVKELELPHAGNPWGVMCDGVLVGPKAFRHHALARQIACLVSGIENPVIVEIGGGFGGCASYLRKLIPQATYIDIDFPEMLFLASYYLGQTGLAGSDGECRPVTRGELLSFAENPGLSMMVPCWLIEALPDYSVDVFLNTFSLSEMPISEIQRYMTLIERCCRGYFLHNNMDRSGVVQNGFERIPCSRFPLSEKKFRKIYKKYDLFQRRHYGRDGDYREVLYQRL